MRSLLDSDDRLRAQTEDEARTLRQSLDELQVGAGAITRAVAVLREKSGQLRALSDLRAEKVDRERILIAERWETYRFIEQYRETRFQDRQKVASYLNSHLGPKIRVSIKQSLADAEYVAAIVSGLRGSSLHYSSLAPLLAERLSPRELVQAVRMEFDRACSARRH